MPPDDPFTPEVIVVPSRGIDRWIAEELSSRFGVLANVEFPTTGLFFHRLLGRGGAPWDNGGLRWAVLDALDQSKDQPWAEPFDHHLDKGAGRRIQLADKLARLFGSYAEDRPAMLLAWAEGQDVLEHGAPIPERSTWQPELWRLTQEIAGETMPPLGMAPDPTTVEEMPGRVCVYGLTRLPVAHGVALQGLSITRDVHLFVLHPSPTAWVATPAPAAERPERIGPRLGGNRLLTAWGRDASELRSLLAHLGIDGAEPASEATSAEDTLLGRLQQAIRDDGSQTRGVPLPEGDRSVQVHGCHGATRQVEVLRDVLLQLFENDPTLEPRDIVIMCPDVEQYAPLLEAVFARRGGADLPDLRLRVADRARSRENELISVLFNLLDLVQGRFGGSKVLDLLALEPVRRALAIGDDDLSMAADLIADAEIRWGLDGKHRTDWGLPDLHQSTWAFGLERLLSGVFLPDTTHELIAGVLPVAGVEADVLPALGGIAEALARLGSIHCDIQEKRTREEWASAIPTLLRLVAAVPPWEEWKWTDLEDEINGVLQPGVSPSASTLDLSDVQEALAGLMAGRVSSRGHRSGDLTVCSLVPMRSVPHRAIVLLGMDDGAFPRRLSRDGDDLRQLRQLAGDRDPGSEDRQLLLDALMAAGEHLIVTYSARDPQTNASLPPAVPIAELLEEAARVSGKPAERIVTLHPLHVFDPCYFGAQGAVPSSFDRLHLAAAAVRGTGDEPGYDFESLEPHRPGEDLALAEVKRVLMEPVKVFCRTRLGLTMGGFDDTRSDLIPTSLSGLEKWGMGDLALGVQLNGQAADDLFEAFRASGAVPPLALGDSPLTKIREKLDGEGGLIELAVDAGLDAAPTSRDIACVVADRHIFGTVTGIRGSSVGSARYGRLKPKHLVEAFLDVVLLTLTDPSVAWQADLIGGAPYVKKNLNGIHLRVGPLGETEFERNAVARAAIEQLLEVHDTALTGPLTIFPDTSGAHALSGLNLFGHASGFWESGDFTGAKEDQDPHHTLLFGPGLEYVDLVGDGSSAFVAATEALWDPITPHVKVVVP